MMGSLSLAKAFSLLVILAYCSVSEQASRTIRRVGIVRASEDETWKTLPSAQVNMKGSELTLKEKAASYPGFMPETAKVIQKRLFENDDGIGPMGCGYRNVSDPTNKTIICSTSPDAGYYRIGCFSILHPVGDGKYVFTSQGCWEQELYALGTCDRDHCVIRVNQNATTPAFCCCTTPFCNEVAQVEYLERMARSQNLVIGEETESDRLSNAIAFFIIFLTCSFLIMILSYLCYRKKRRASFVPLPTYQVPRELNKETLQALEELKEGQISDVKLYQEIGRGKFGGIFRGEFLQKGETKVVAVKMTDVSNAEFFLAEKSCFECEYEHPSILKFFGYFIREFDIGMVFEYLPMGSLQRYLALNTVQVEDAHSIIVSLLDALTFLHEEKLPTGEYKPTIVHRDIKSGNVLIKKSGDRVVSILGDFGLSVVCKDSSISEKGRGQVGTRRYMAPELLEGATEFTVSAYRKIDVYALSLVIWEVLLRADTAKRTPLYKFPYEAELGISPTLADLRIHVVQKRQRPGLRLDLDQHEVLGPISRSLGEMWAHEPESRVSVGCMWERIRVLAIRTKLDNRTPLESLGHIALSRGMLTDSDYTGEKIDIERTDVIPENPPGYGILGDFNGEPVEDPIYGPVEGPIYGPEKYEQVIPRGPLLLAQKNL
ncbi:unnamed protein product [Auanema sp. JU1783]|nr:unnamed protein product [Auanema sp. JU1783]